MVDSHADIDEPSSWVERFAPLISQGEVLDLACGSGRHARLLAAQGHQVVAVDRDAVALGRTAGTGIDILELDLESGGANGNVSWPFEANRFKSVVVTNYLHRPLFPRILESLAPGGLLIYETFAVGNERFGKPSNPAFLLRPNELLDVARTEAASPLHVIAFEDGYVEFPRPAIVQRICAAKPGLAGNPTRLRLI